MVKILNEITITQCGLGFSRMNTESIFVKYTYLSLIISSLVLYDHHVKKRSKLSHYTSALMDYSYFNNVNKTYI